MVIHGYVWLSMDICGYMVICGYPWFPWLSMANHGYPWLSLVIHGYPWLSMVIHGLHVASSFDF